MDNVFFAFILTLLAGLSTGIGGATALLSHKTNTKFLSLGLGFSAGVMVYISMTELFFEARNVLSVAYGLKPGVLYATLAFFSGMLLTALIDKAVPSPENPHEIQHVCNIHDPRGQRGHEDPKLLRMGLFTALVVAIHNFPEGLATFISALQQPSIAIPITLAIAIHNVPEGIAIAIPVYYATGDKRKAFGYAFLSGLSEPAGALIGYLILRPYMSDTLFGLLFAAIAGIMVFISLDELLPSAREYGEHHLSIYGLIAGMAIMAFSLWLFL